MNGYLYRNADGFLTVITCSYARVLYKVCMEEVMDDLPVDLQGFSELVLSQES